MDDNFFLNNVYRVLIAGHVAQPASSAAGAEMRHWVHAASLNRYGYCAVANVLEDVTLRMHPHAGYCGWL